MHSDQNHDHVLHMRAKSVTSQQVAQ